MKRLTSDPRDIAELLAGTCLGPSREAQQTEYTRPRFFNTTPQYATCDLCVDTTYDNCVSIVPPIASSDATYTSLKRSKRSTSAAWDYRIRLLPTFLLQTTPVKGNVFSFNLQKAIDTANLTHLGRDHSQTINVDSFWPEGATTQYRKDAFMDTVIQTYPALVREMYTNNSLLQRFEAATRIVRILGTICAVASNKQAKLDGLYARCTRGAVPGQTPRFYDLQAVRKQKFWLLAGNNTVADVMGAYLIDTVELINSDYVGKSFAR
jgi:hypothetical protein